MSGCCHHSGSKKKLNNRNLIIAIVFNGGLTLAQILGGIFSGSLSLIADAFHNFSDMSALVIALLARKFSSKSPDEKRNFGYQRAETIAAFINVIMLIITSVYLILEAVERYFNPTQINGEIITIVASVALFVDVATAITTFSYSKENLNMRAVFLHNLTDAMASVGVIVSGILISKYQMYFLDTILTVLIAIYIIFHVKDMLPKVVHVLMNGKPESVNLKQVIKDIESIENVVNVHNLHIWSIDEDKNALNCHIKLENCELKKVDEIKKEIKVLLSSKFAIEHSVIEFEFDCCEEKNTK